VLAASVRIDRLIEADVGRLVARNDGARRIGLNGRDEWRQLFFETSPTIVHDLYARAFEPPFRIGDGAAASPRGRFRKMSHGPILLDIKPVSIGAFSARWRRVQAQRGGNEI